MFASNARFLLFDYFRTPYVKEAGRDAGLSPFQFVRADLTGRRLLYLPAGGAVAPPEPFLLGEIRLFSGVATNDGMKSALEAEAGAWAAAEELISPAGPIGALWRNDRGDVALPFDPNDAILNYWSERYQRAAGTSRTRRVRSLLVRGYYRVRPILPRGVQIAIRRSLSRVQARTAFPRWPVEASLHDFYRWLFGELRQLNGGSPIPTIGPWPAGRRWALVLTHDVETSVGVESVHLLREIEVERGYRSSWNFVPHRYSIPGNLLAELVADGFEVGVHGLKHDGRDLESLATLQQRLPEIRRYAREWSATGFRSPATHRRWEWMPLLGFDYDSSYPDSDPFEPQPGGCCTWLPFFNENLVELPITLPQDYTLFTILRVQDEQPWLRKAEFLREQGGMALLIAHPDYMLEQRELTAYARFLEAFSGDDTLWRALPKDVSAWWRRRAASGIERSSTGWSIVGPAAGEAQLVEL